MGIRTDVYGGDTEIDGFRGGGVRVWIDGAENTYVWLEVLNAHDGLEGDGESVPLSLSNLRDLKQVIDNYIKRADEFLVQT